MHAITPTLAITVSLAAALQRDTISNFENLDYADEDIYFARPVGGDGSGLDFGSNFGLFPVGENNTAAGGLEVTSPTNVAAYTFRGTTLSRIIETRPYEGFVPSSFDFHSFAFGCITLTEPNRHLPKKPVMCTLTVKGYSSSSSANLVARQTFDFKPMGRAQAKMKKARLDPAFKGLKYLLFDMDSKERKAETAALFDDLKVTMYGEQTTPP